MRYVGDVYRPPSEAGSLIVQVTYGCSHNTCAFCSMYKNKVFQIRPLKEIIEDFEEARSVYGGLVRRIFLADGDALIRKTDELLLILNRIRLLFPDKERVSCYASPASLLLKSEEELVLLKKNGLDLVYLGLESGADQVLQKVHKGYSAEEIILAGQKAREAGLALSVTAISGLGSYALSEVHAAETARALSAMNPEYIGLLTLEIIGGTPMYDWIDRGEFIVMDSKDILRETRILMEKIDSQESIFRANHASNYLTLRGKLNEDRASIIGQIDLALDGQIRLRPEWMRGL